MSHRPLSTNSGSPIAYKFPEGDRALPHLASVTRILSTKQSVSTLAYRTVPNSKVTNSKVTFIKHSKASRITFQTVFMANCLLSMLVWIWRNAELRIIHITKSHLCMTPNHWNIDTTLQDFIIYQTKQVTVHYNISSRYKITLGVE